MVICRSLYYDARSEKHQITPVLYSRNMCSKILKILHLKKQLSEFGTLSRARNNFKNHKVSADEEAAVLRSATESTNLSISSPIENGNKESISETLSLDETDTMEKIRYE